MNKSAIFFLLALGIASLSACKMREQEKSYHAFVTKHRTEIAEKFKDSLRSPMREKAREFTALPYFDPDPAFKVEASSGNVICANRGLRHDRSPEETSQVAGIGTVLCDKTIGH